MRIVRISPEEYYGIDDVFAADRWICSRCGLLLDYQFDPEGPGWPRFDPPLNAHYDWVDDDGDIHMDEPERNELCPRCDLEFKMNPPVKVDISPLNSIEDLEKAISRGEGDSMEFKEEFPEAAVRVANIIASFANVNGGKVFFGVGNDGSMVGYPGIDTPEGKDGFRQRVRGVLGGIQPKLEARVDFFSDGEGLDVALVTVPRGPYPIYLSGNVAYVRRLDESRPASPEEITQIILKQRPIPR